MSPALRHARNYYAWIADQFRPHLGKRVLDVGGGHGPHLDHVVAPGRFVMSVDLSPECVGDMRKRFAGAEFEARVGDISDPTLATELAGLGFDTIVCVNVLEHIEDDAAALRGMAKVLAPANGRLFLLVPAHPLLFGTPDVLAGHFRRYSRHRLVDALSAAGFVVTRAAYFNGLGAIPYLLNARVLKPRTLSGSVDTQIVLFDRYFVPVLRRLERVVPVPFGQSLIAWAEVRR
jgi:2-polyprenyl-3-methyl-5-hydroxy-6-metoxy-1,4-benzoquinol methylase